MKYNDRLKEDWNFTNNIHKKLVFPLFNETFQIFLEQADLKIDQEYGIDYIGSKDNSIIPAV